MDLLAENLLAGDVLAGESLAKDLQSGPEWSQSGPSKIQNATSIRYHLRNIPPWFGLDSIKTGGEVGFRILSKFLLKSGPEWSNQNLYTYFIGNKPS